MTLASIRRFASQAQVLEQVHDSVIATDLDGIIASWNSGAERLHGYRAEEAIGRPVSFLYAAEEQPTLLARRRDAVLARGFADLDAITIAKSGERRAVHARLSLIRDDAGAPVGILSFAIDTTELERARGALKDCECQLRTILDAIPLYVAHWGRDQTLLFANRAYETFSGYSPDDLRGRSLEELIGPSYAQVRPYMLKALRGKSNESTHEFTLKSGEKRLISVQRVPDRSADGQVNGYFTVGTDVTERIRGEAQRLQQERTLRDALITEVNHRVQNNLQSIVGLLRLEVQQDASLLPLLQPAITKLLAVSVGFGLMSSTGTRGLNLCDITCEITRNLAEVTGASIETNLHESIRQQPVRVDDRYAVHVALVLNELMSNAIKHAPAATTGSARILVHLERTEAAGATVRILSPGGRLPADFDFDAAAGLRTGLKLVRVLLPAEIATLRFESDSAGVTAELRIAGASARE